MFKWICLIVAVAFLASLLWLVNDVRLEVRRAVDAVKQSSTKVNEHLPTIVEKAERTTVTLANLADDIRQLKELLGVANSPRDKNLVSYADRLLDVIEKSGGTIGVTKTLGSGLKNTVPALEWVVAARKEALFLTMVAKSKTELLNRLTETKFGSAWHIQLPEQEPLPLVDWLKAHHPGTVEQ